jgi:hypothetical protein
MPLRMSLQLAKLLLVIWAKSSTCNNQEFQRKGLIIKICDHVTTVRNFSTVVVFKGIIGVKKLDSNL